MEANKTELEFWKWFFDTMLWPIIILVVAAFTLAIIYKRMKPKNNPTSLSKALPFPEDPWGYGIEEPQSQNRELPSRFNIPQEAREFAENSEDEPIKELLDKDDGEKLTKQERFLFGLIKTGKGKVSVKALDKKIEAFGMKWKTDIEIENQPEEPFLEPKPTEEKDPDAIPKRDKPKEKEEETAGTN